MPRATAIKYIQRAKPNVLGSTLAHPIAHQPFFYESKKIVPQPGDTDLNDKKIILGKTGDENKKKRIFGVELGFKSFGHDIKNHIAERSLSRLSDLAIRLTKSTHNRLSAKS